MLPDEYTNAERARLQILQAVEGYAELKMWECAWEELLQLSPPEMERLEVQEIKLMLLMRESRWTEATALGQMLCQQYPDRPQLFIHTAFCLHESSMTEDALRTLRAGPNSLQQVAVYHYNCACYLAVLGHPDDAREMLRTAFALDEALHENARTDPDLKSLREKPS